MITRPPGDQHVVAGADVTFPCDVTTDPAEQSALKVEWSYRGEPVNVLQEGGRLAVNPLSRALTVRGARVEDTGAYTCRADNGVDRAENTATLIVRGKGAGGLIFELGVVILPFYILY